MKNHQYLIILFSLIVLVSGCATIKVERVDRSEKIDLSGKWNDYDAYLVSKDLIEECLSSRWLGNFMDNSGVIPTIIVGHVANRSSDHINTAVLIKSLEKDLVNSGKVIFVASSQERSQMRTEREDQLKGFTDPETIKKHGRELGADLIIIGSINSVKDEIKGKSAFLYQVNLEVVDLTTNQKLWIGQKELKKSIKVSKFSL